MTPKGLKFMILGLAVMIVGYILLSGGGSDDPKVFNFDMFNARRMILSPLVILSGIIVVILSIMGKFDDKEENS